MIDHRINESIEILRQTIKRDYALNLISGGFCNAHVVYRCEVLVIIETTYGVSSDCARSVDTAYYSLDSNDNVELIAEGKHIEEDFEEDNEDK
ncbi:MAG: hypothetical protein GY861_05725 [bacterium]|nr:hypothetical protein [bacterium]